LLGAQKFSLRLKVLLLMDRHVLIAMWRHFCYGDCYVRVQASIAEAVVRWNCLPDKMNPVVRPLMDALRREENAELQVGCFCCWQCNSRGLNK